MTDKGIAHAMHRSGHFPAVGKLKGHAFATCVCGWESGGKETWNEVELAFKDHVGEELERILAAAGKVQES